MPEIPTLTIFDPSGTERATLAGISAERTRHVTERGSARFVVDREEWQSIASAINRRGDRFRIDADGETGWFGGRFRDTERGTQTVTVILDDYERDARDAQPTGGQVLFQNVDDATVVQDALSRIPTLSPGTIETVATGLSFSFANAEPAKMIRDAAQPGGALVRYNADRTVDFIERPAVDGTEPELSTATGTLVGEPDISDDNRNPPTEIIGLGAQSGPNQVRATATVDPNAARDVYRRYENKDIQQQSRLQTTVDRLAAEVAAATEKLDVETEAVSLSVAPGDPIDFVWPAEEINATLRVIEYTEAVTQRGRRYAPLRVSNRWPEQGGADKAVADLERFNRGYQGFIDRDNFSLDNQPVAASLNAEDSYFYPDDVIDEVRAEIRVRGRPYRAYSSGAELNTEFENVFHVASSYSTESLTANNEFEDIGPSFSPDQDIATLLNFVLIEDAEGTGSVQLRLHDETDDIYYPRDTPGNYLEVNLPEPDGISQTAHTPIAVNVKGHTLQWEANLIDLSDQAARFKIFSDAIGTHTHDPDPGVTEFDLYPSNCDVLVNGTSAGVSLGDGTSEFAETVDISGLLSPGDNEIEITSDTTGRVTGAVRTELFRQGPEDTV
jgi:hypothetical protein